MRVNFGQVEAAAPPTPSRHVTVTVKQRTFLRELVSICTPIIIPDSRASANWDCNPASSSRKPLAFPSTKCQGFWCAGVLSLINTVPLGLRTKRLNFKKAPCTLRWAKKKTNREITLRCPFKWSTRKMQRTKSLRMCPHYSTVQPQ